MDNRQKFNLLTSLKWNIERIHTAINVSAFYDDDEVEDEYECDIKLGGRALYTIYNSIKNIEYIAGELESDLKKQDEKNECTCRGKK